VSFVTERTYTVVSKVSHKKVFASRHELFSTDERKATFFVVMVEVGMEFPSEYE